MVNLKKKINEREREREITFIVKTKNQASHCTRCQKYTKYLSVFNIIWAKYESVVIHGRHKNFGEFFVGSRAVKYFIEKIPLLLFDSYESYTNRCLTIMFIHKNRPDFGISSIITLLID